MGGWAVGRLGGWAIGWVDGWVVESVGDNVRVVTLVIVLGAVDYIVVVVPVNPPN